MSALRKAFTFKASGEEECEEWYNAISTCVVRQNS